MKPPEVLESASKSLAMTSKARRLLTESATQRAMDMFARHEERHALMGVAKSVPRTTEELNANLRTLVDVALEGQRREERMEALTVESVRLASRATRVAQLTLLVSLLAIVATIVVALAS